MCEFSDSGFGSPTIFSVIMNVLTAFEVPVHLVGAYCILFHTPPKMLSVKMSMFVMHFWSCSLDIILTFLVIPYTLFPLSGGIPLGLLSTLNVSPVIQAFLILTCGGITGMSILAFFENRYNSMKFGPYSQSLSTRIKRCVFLALNYMMAIGFVVPIYYHLPTKEEALNHTKKIFPCIPDPIINNPRYFMISTSNQFIFAIIGGMTLLVCSQIFFFVIYSVIALQNRTKKLHRVTSILQKRFFLALYIQVAIPMFAYLFPVIYVFCTWLFDYFNQSLNNLTFICIAMHGLLSTLVMLVVHKPYRKALKLKLKLPSCDMFRKRSKVASVRELQLSTIQ